MSTATNIRVNRLGVGTPQNGQAEATRMCRPQASQQKSPAIPFSREKRPYPNNGRRATPSVVSAPDDEPGMCLRPIPGCWFLAAKLRDSGTINWRCQLMVPKSRSAAANLKCARNAAAFVHISG